MAHSSHSGTENNPRPESASSGGQVSSGQTGEASTSASNQTNEQVLSNPTIPGPASTAVPSPLSPDTFVSHFRCSICRKLVVEAQVLNCSHVFCGHCIRYWLLTDRVCPECREVVTRETPVLSIDNALASYFERQPDERRSERLSLQLFRAEMLPIRRRVVTSTVYGPQRVDAGTFSGPQRLRGHLRRTESTETIDTVDSTDSSPDLAPPTPSPAAEPQAEAETASTASHATDPQPTTGGSVTITLNLPGAHRISTAIARAINRFSRSDSQRSHTGNAPERVPVPAASQETAQQHVVQPVIVQEQVRTNSGHVLQWDGSSPLSASLPQGQGQGNNNDTASQQSTSGNTQSQADPSSSPNPPGN